MKYVKRLAVMALALSGLVFGVAPADAVPAVSSSTLGITGYLRTGSGLNTGASVALNTSCYGGTVGSTNGVGTCALNTYGTGSGNCAVWTGSMSGHIFGTAYLGSNVQYSLSITVAFSGNILTIVGTATAPNGSVKQVYGEAAAVPPLTYSSGCMNNYAAEWIVAGAVTITG